MLSTRPLLLITLKISIILGTITFSFVQAATDCNAVTQIPQTECQALIDFYHSTNGPNWKNNSGWNTTNEPCNWYGVACSNGHVTKLGLYYNKLSGSIPESLGVLVNLKKLYLSHNQLSGSIPESLGNLTNLQELALGNNQFSSSLPESLGNLTKLEELHLEHNQLSGSIPESLGNLTKLQVLGLGNNQFSGTLPESLGNLTNLEPLYLENNQFSGTLPESLGNLTNLQVLTLGNNQFSGSLPESLGNLTKLEELHLEHNQLSGSIPESLGNLTNLWQLYLEYNQLSGFLPESLGNLAYLSYLNLSNNQFSGTLPSSLGNRSRKLSTLMLNDNNFCGGISTSWMNVSWAIQLQNNHLSAYDPELIEWLNAKNPEWATTQTSCPYVLSGTDVCNSVTQIPQVECQALMDFYHSTNGPNWKNNSGWNITNEPCNWRGVSCRGGHVTRLYLSGNQLSGPLPESLGNLTKLVDLRLDNNQLSGSLPNSLEVLTNLELLSLRHNQLSGSIPKILPYMRSLSFLYLNHNQLSGSIPESFGYFNYLLYVDLSHNQLSGPIPESLGNLIDYSGLFLYMSLNDNELCGEIPISLMNPDVHELGLQNNHLTSSDPELIEWLNDKNPEWATTQTPCPCFVYAVHDDKLNNSQLFTIDPFQNFQVNALGDTHQGYDLEGLDFHPQTLTLYASSGDDPAQDLPAGYLYQVDKTNGNLTPVCHTGLGEVSAMAFHPQEGSLWVWADKEGLFTVDINQVNQGTCHKTEIISANTNVEGLTWDNQGKILYAASGKALYQFDSQTGIVDKTCKHFPSQVEALSMLNTNELLFSLHKSSDTSIYSFDPNNCAITNSLSINTPYSDIEGIVWMCP